ncbi:hypothetical protein PENTCL1PPCAC_20502, partial [Pristionchus entomophagus]
IEDNKRTLDFIIKFMQKIIIETMHFVVYSEAELDNALKLMATFPTIKHTMDLWFLPNEEKLQSLPKMKKLTIIVNQMPVSVFFHLLGTLKNFYLGRKPMTLTSNKFMEAIQVISADRTEREVELTMLRSDVVYYMSIIGIYETAKSGDVCGEFEVCSAPDGPVNGAGLMLRYKR